LIGRKDRQPFYPRPHGIFRRHCCRARADEVIQQSYKRYSHARRIQELIAASLCGNKHLALPVWCPGSRAKLTEYSVAIAVVREACARRGIWD
jgi:hypothetical protein